MYTMRKVGREGQFLVAHDWPKHMADAPRGAQMAPVVVGRLIIASHLGELQHTSN
jgi:hypothetical protein